MTPAVIYNNCNIKKQNWSTNNEILYTWWYLDAPGDIKPFLATAESLL